MNTNLKINALENWSQFKKKPLIIAGPCSAETPEQLLAAAQGIKKIKNVKVDIFRAGIWKPRTRPNSFEGAGVEGLKWLADIEKELDIPVSTEVANASHVEQALKYNVKVLWIGARTTVSPFSIQEIADSLRGVKGVSVLVKNPTHPELGVWIGAFERLNQAGVENLAAIHRGFAAYDKSKYRNETMWQIPLELRRIVPHIPIICDPSHIAGKREFLFEISQRALDLNLDGLMIETHPDPDKAWSDADQQITPEVLDKLLSNLKLEENIAAAASNFVNRSVDLRRRIDTIDKELIEIIANRLNITEKLHESKKEDNVAAFQVKWWEDDIVRNRVELGKKVNLNEEYIAQLFKIIQQEALKKQREEVRQRVVI